MSKTNTTAKTGGKAQATPKSLNPLKVKLVTPPSKKFADAQFAFGEFGFELYFGGTLPEGKPHYLVTRLFKSETNALGWFFDTWPEVLEFLEHTRRAAHE